MKSKSERKLPANITYNPKLKKWQMVWEDKDDAEHGIWADTEEEVIEIYKELYEND